MALLDDVAVRIGAANKVLLTSHRGPDGDSVGSMLALYSLLRSQGKEPVLYNPDLVPRSLKWLPGAKKLVHRLPKDARFDVTIVVDCPDAKLLGPSFPGSEMTGFVVVLDHHSSTRPFGDAFVCDEQASSVGVLVARIAKGLAWPLTDDAALGIFVSMATDTGWFRYANTNAEALRLAATLVEEHNVSTWQISERFHERGSIKRYRLMSATLNTLELVSDGQLAFMTLTHEMVRAANASWEDSQGLVEYARAIAGVECGVLLTPAKRGGVRVSLRSKGKVDAGAVCKELGGGGHVGAAACTLQGTLAEARTKVEAMLSRALTQTEDAG